MKLISCHIAGYGALENYSLNLNGGITEILRDNGAGKTTIASFLKAMLYGLENDRKNAKDFNDRKHFAPFGGGSFGGNLTLEYNGSSYRIERGFDVKSGKNDVLTVYRDGIRTDDFNETEPGVFFFGVDRESFERTLFITADDVEISATSDVKSKLGGVIQSADDTDCKSAVKILDKAIKSYKPEKVTQSSQALIPELKKQNERTRDTIRNLEEIQRSLDGKYDSEERLKGQINEKESLISNAQKQETRKAQHGDYHRQLYDIEKAQKVKDELEEKYPNGIPTEADIEDIKSLQEKRNDITSKSSVAVFSEDEREALKKHKEQFSVGIPNESELQDIDSEIKTQTEKSIERDNLSKYEQTNEENHLRSKFHRTQPTNEEITKADENLKSYRETKEKLEGTPRQITSGTPTVTVNSPTPAPYIATAALSALLTVLGIALIAMKNTSLGAVLTAVGAVILAVTGFLYLNKKSSPLALSVVTADNPEYTNLQNELKKIEERLKSFLLPYGYNSENGVASDLTALKNDLDRYYAYLDREKERTDKISKLSEDIKASEQKQSEFFSRYGVEALTELRSDIQAYTALVKREDDAREAQSAALEKLKEIDCNLGEYSRKYPLASLNTEQLSLDKNEHGRLSDEIKEKSKKAENYRTEYGITDDLEPENEPFDRESADAELSALRNELALLQSQISSDEAETAKLDDLRAELEEGDEKLREYEATHALLSAARDFLTEANDALNTRYVKPVLDEFTANTDMLGTAIGKKMTLNRNYELSFEENGTLRSEKHLSAGQRTLCALCFRISLIRNMYKEDVPFIILDDPFLSLDETNMERAKALLTSLSNELQILYFTCHPSRSLD